MRLFALLALTLSVGCAGKHKGTYEVAAATAPAAQAPTALEEGDALFAERADKAKLEAAVARYEAAFAADPTNRVAGAKLVRATYLLGDIHESDDAAKIARWDKAIAYGKQCIAINADFAAMLQKGDEDEATAAKVLTVDDVPCTYWTATALGKWAKASGTAKLLKNLGTVKAWVARVEELDPTYFYGAPDRYWGAYYASIPSFAGQDLNKSKTHFDKSLSIAPNYLATRVLMAENWAVKSQNKAEFKRILAEVIAADAAIDPAIAAENAAEQAKAKALLAREGEFFAE
jgi:hypothetical protein